MTDDSPPRPALLAGTILALDVIDDHVVLLAPDARIVHANVAWQRFALDNGDSRTDWVGVDYLAASSEPCVQAGIDDPITDGIRDVLDGRRRTFTHEYDCHAPDELRWFRLTATAAHLPGISAVVVHTETTPQRMAERALGHHATHDRVTGLHNRAAAEQHIAQLLTEKQSASVIELTLSDTARHPELLHEDDLVRAASTLAELFPAPAFVSRWDTRTLLVVLSGIEADQLDEGAEILRDTLPSLFDRPIVADVSARPIRDPSALAAMGRQRSHPAAGA
jgi:GGDEF domain-containing protein